MLRPRIELKFGNNCVVGFWGGNGMGWGTGWDWLRQNKLVLISCQALVTVTTLHTEFW